MDFMRTWQRLHRKKIFLYLITERKCGVDIFMYSPPNVREIEWIKIIIPYKKIILSLLLLLVSTFYLPYCNTKSKTLPPITHKKTTSY